MTELTHGDFTGEAEIAWVLATLKEGLVGGRVWKTQVPDEQQLEYDDDGALRPYLILANASPYANPRGRFMAVHEQQQPHVLSMSLQAIAGDSDSAERTLNAAKRLLVGFAPSLSAGVITARGGHSWSHGENTSRPTRYVESAFLRCGINLDPDPLDS